MDKKQYQEAIDLFEGYIYDKEVAELETDSLFYGIYKNFNEGNSLEDMHDLLALKIIKLHL